MNKEIPTIRENRETLQALARVADGTARTTSERQHRSRVAVGIVGAIAVVGAAVTALHYESSNAEQHCAPYELATETAARAYGEYSTQLASAQAERIEAGC